MKFYSLEFLGKLGADSAKGHNGWSPQIIAQYYNKVLDQFPLPWWEAVKDEPYLQVAQFQGQEKWLRSAASSVGQGKRASDS